MAMSRSFKNGSDEVREQASDFCCICANNARIQPASYFCFECGVFGRYLCGTCFRNHNLFVSNHDVSHIGSQSNSRIEEKDKTLQKLGREVKKLKTDNKMMEIELNKARAEKDERDCMVQNMERLLEKLNSENTVVMSKIKEPCSENEKFKEERIKTANDIKKLRSEKFALEGNFEKYRKNMEKLNRDNQKKLDDLTEDKEKEVSSLNNKLSEIIKKRVDLKTRSDPANRETLLRKREEELKEREEECTILCRKIEEKDKTLQKLDVEVKKLKTDNKMMEDELKKAIQERDERQSMVQNMEKQLEKLNSENTAVMSKIKELCSENENFKEERIKTAYDIKKLTSEKFALEGNFEKYRKNMEKYVEKLNRDNKKMLDDLTEDKEKEVRSLNSKLSEIIKERDDLKTRFRKLAGAKLTDQNADIADLSDPNRAMKVSERFGQLYDDEWTDAFEELKKKKMDGKDAIQLLLHILQECHAFCNNLKEAQIDSLNNVLLHPSQDITKFANEHRKNIGGLKERPRISSKDEKAVRNLRRQIGVTNTCIEEVKQVFVLETKSWVDRGFDKKQLEVCKPYFEKCAEVCWLMVLHDPPLYMKMDASEGDKMDSNLYTVYSTFGDKIRYLVWPPLYNEAGGGLISKGVAECFKIIKKN